MGKHRFSFSGTYQGPTTKKIENSQSFFESEDLEESIEEELDREEKENEEFDLEMIEEEYVE